MLSVLIWLLVIVSAINLFRYLRKARPPVNRDPLVHYEQELARVDRRRKWGFIVIGSIVLLAFLARVFLDWF